jgi:hypothetical protein
MESPPQRAGHRATSIVELHHCGETKPSCRPPRFPSQMEPHRTQEHFPQLHHSDQALWPLFHRHLAVRHRRLRRIERCSIFLQQNTSKHYGPTQPHPRAFFLFKQPTPRSSRLKPLRPAARTPQSSNPSQYPSLAHVCSRTSPGVQKSLSIFLKSIPTSKIHIF